MAERGRPTEYTPERGEAICELIATSERGLHWLHEQHPDIVPPVRTFWAWLDRYPELQRNYARAREMQTEFIVSEGGRIIDECEPCGEGSMPSALVAKAKEQAQHRRWVASRLAPKRWGDRVEHDLGEKAAITLSDLVKRANGSADESG